MESTTSSRVPLEAEGKGIDMKLSVVRDGFTVFNGESNSK